VNQLVTRPIPADDHEFWKLVFISNLSAEDIFALVQPSDVRRLRRKQPINLATLIFKSIEQLFLFTSADQSDYSSARNSIRILSRIIPFVFENGRFDSDEDDEEPPPSAHVPQGLEDTALDRGVPQASAPLPAGYDFVENFFWNNRILQPDGQDIVYSVLGDQPLTMPLGRLLVTLLLDCCAYPGFTQPPGTKEMGPVPGHPYLETKRLWCGGVGVPDCQIPSSNATIDSDRIDVLRCILACCTQTLYEKDGLYRNRFTEALAIPTSPQAVTLCYSMLNVVAAYNPRGTLPYTSWMGVSREALVDAALHVLLTALDYSYFSWRTPGDKNTQEHSSTQASSSSASNEHSFWIVLQNITSESDCQVIYKGLTTLLGNHVDAANTYLPMSQKTISCHAELLLLLWKLIDVNKTFRATICKKFDICQLMVCLLWYVYESHGDQIKNGILQITTFIILSLSGERDLGIALNAPFTKSFPVEMALFAGNHVDLLLMLFHHVIMTNKPWVKSLHDCLFITICNLSPYIKGMSMNTASKLIHLIDVFTSPKNMARADAKHITNVGLLVESFNNLIQYQYEGNVSVVYGIIRAHQCFERIEQMCSDPKPGDDPHLPKLHPQVREQIQINTIMRLLAALKPELEARPKGATETEMLSFLRATTLVGLLPVPHPILIRRFDSQTHTHAWVTTWTWGIIYLRAITPPMLDGNNIRLFRITAGDDYEKPPESKGKEKGPVPIPMPASSSTPAEFPEPEPGKQDLPPRPGYL
jgi:hypothetical protein